MKTPVEFHDDFVNESSERKCIAMVRDRDIEIMETCATLDPVRIWKLVDKWRRRPLYSRSSRGKKAR